MTLGDPAEVRILEENKSQLLVCNPGGNRLQLEGALAQQQWHDSKANAARLILLVGTKSCDM
jgi:hypothetical protein